MRKFTLDQALAMAKTIGIKYMTFKDVHLPRTDPPDTIAANRRKIEAAGITIMGGGTITHEERARADPEGLRLREARRLPADLHRARAGRARLHRADGEGARHQGSPSTTTARKTSRTRRRCDAYNAIKNRDKRMGLCVDIGHTSRTGTDFVQAIVDFKDRVYDLHVKDLSDPKNKDAQVEVGRGVFDFPRLFRTLLQIGYPGQVGLEYEIKEDDPLPGMIESIAYMRGVLAALTQTT